MDTPSKMCDLCGAPTGIPENDARIVCVFCEPVAHSPTAYRAAKRAVERTRKETYAAGFVAGRTPVAVVLQECLDDVDLFDAMREPDEGPQGSIAGRAREALDTPAEHPTLTEHPALTSAFAAMRAAEAEDDREGK